MDNEVIATGVDLLAKMRDEFEIRSQKLSLLQNTLGNIEDEIDLVKEEIRVRIDKKAELLEKQIVLLGKIQELDEFILASGRFNHASSQEKENSNYPTQSHSLMVSGNFAGYSSDYVVQYFQRFGNIVKVTDKYGFGTSLKNGFRYIFLKFDNFRSVDIAVANSPHLINDVYFQARRGKDY